MQLMMTRDYQKFVVWLTGLSGAGKTSIAVELELALRARGHALVRLDGDVLRKGLCRDLGFTPEDRAENIRRAAEVCGLLLDAGQIVLAAFISPFAAERAQARALIERHGRFFEVFVVKSKGKDSTGDKNLIDGIIVCVVDRDVEVFIWVL
jgi:adenylylsulfate kinase-like enzyme